MVTIIISYQSGQDRADRIMLRKLDEVSFTEDGGVEILGTLLDDADYHEHWPNVGTFLVVKS